MTDQQHLWSDMTGTRHFLIPDVEVLPEGRLILRTSTGRRLQVCPESASAFEITEEEAKTWLKEQFIQVMENAKTGFMKALRRGSTPKAESPTDVDSEAEAVDDTVAKTEEEIVEKTERETVEKTKVDAAISSVSPILELLSTLSGTSPDALRTDIKSLNAGAQKIFNELGEIIKNSLSQQEPDRQAAKDKINRLRNLLLERGIPTDDKLQDIPERIRLLVKTLGQDAGKTADDLESLAEFLEQSVYKASVNLRRFAQHMRSTESD